MDLDPQHIFLLGQLTLFNSVHAELRLCPSDSYLLHAELRLCPTESYLLPAEFKSVHTSDSVKVLSSFHQVRHQQESSYHN